MDPEIKKFVVHELAAATFVPYNADGSVNYAGVDAHARDLAVHGVLVAFINGTTGDSMILREEERKLLSEAWVAAGKKYGLRVMNHIGAQGLAEACELARHAQATGCDAICAMAPQFFKTLGAKGLAQWLKAIGEAAPKMPLYYYNFPVITGVDTNPLHLLQAIEEVGIPQFRGMKFTDFNTWYFENCLTYREGLYDICYGRDECLLSGVVLGAKGHIGNGFNFAPGPYQRIRAAFAAGDIATARAEQHRANYTVNTINDARFGPHSLATARLMYELKSKGAVALGPPRAPFAPLTEAQAAALKAELTQSGYFEWCDEVVRADVPSA